MLKRIRELLTGRSRTSADEILPVRPDEGRSASPKAPEVHKGPRVVHQPIARSDLDPDAVKIIGRLTRFDHSAYLVGGCVRDLLLERKPKDFDIGTSATPRQIKRLFRNSRIIGRRFRLAHIYFQNGKIIEVATFRGLNDDDTDGDGDGDDSERDLLIRDDNQFGSIEEDALRRDFTINSLFYDLNKGTVLDHADGLGDLRRRLVRTIGDPTIRFREDPIRILRAIKFAARLDFEIERQTLGALRGARNEIPKAAPPRILEEINRFCRGGAARRSFELLRENQVLEIIAPELATRYEKVDGSWELLLALLETLDGGAQNGDEVATGRILSMLVLPALLDDLGWKPDGQAVRPEGLDVRAVVDEVVRPLAVRLRMARKDQEHCRHVIGTLCRMVPAGSVHRNTKRSILRRASLGDALAILDVVARELGADFAEAERYWKSATAGRPPGAPDAQPKPGRRPARRDDGSGPPARRRRGRGGRGDSRGDSSGEAPAAKSSKEVPAAKASKEPRKPSGEKLPPVWDDGYFFAALPSVPAADAEKNTAPAPEPEAPPPSEESKPEDRGAAVAGEAPERPKRKRRPRRRRKAASKKTPAVSSESDD